MKNRADHHLNGGGVVPEHHNGPIIIIIHTIGGGITLPKSTNRIVHLIRLGPKVITTPHNGLLNDGPNLTNR
jgi:hypothetical protein